MAKEKPTGKRLKISEAQQHTLLAVLGASVFLGAAIAFVMSFTKQISFNAKVIGAQDQSISSYSNTITTIGICKKPKGATYTDEEIKKCDPNNIDVSDIPGTLRSNILTNLANNAALNSVPKADDASCINQSTGKRYTYAELNKMFDDASDSNNEEEFTLSRQLMKSCSALRVIPDALPAYKNEEALLASLNQLFIDSDWEPESISPGGEITSANIGTNLNAVSVSLSIEASTSTTMTVLKNIERSIREFNVRRASIEFSGTNNLELHAQATAYYMNPSAIQDSSITITGDK